VPFEFTPLTVPDVILVRARGTEDARGSFMETWRRADFERAGIRADFRQDNQSRTSRRGTLRGLHFQRDPHAQAKLIRCTRGRVFDVAVDIRAGSPTFGRFAAAELSEAEPAMVFVPRGFAHGYVALTDGVEVVYKVDADYAPQAEGGVLWNDPALGIPWPVGDPVLSDRDRRWPALKDLAR